MTQQQQQQQKQNKDSSGGKCQVCHKFTAIYKLRSLALCLMCKNEIDNENKL